MPRNANELVIIMWRDIPAQVNGRLGGERHQVMLAHRFQKAIDRAAMVAGKKTAQEYVGEWRRTTHAVVGDLVECVSTTAEHIEREFTNERLNTLVTNGGWDPNDPDRDPAATESQDSQP